MTTVQPSGVKTSKIVGSGSALELFRNSVRDRNTRIVDIGCGAGVFMAQLKECGFTDVYGVEASDYSTLNEFSVTHTDLSAERLPWQDSFCGVVTAWEVMEHLENPYFAIREIHRVLKPEGIFMFSMPNAFHWSNRIYFLLTGNFLRWNSKNDHRTIFTHHVAKKSYASYFDLVTTVHVYPEFWQAKFRGPLRRLNGMFKNRLNRWFPANEFFSHFIVYVLRKRT